MVPQHVGFIIDGNRRWAAKHGKSVFEGHRQGVLRAREIARYCIDRGVKVASFYGFSTENWNRSAKEVSDLMGLFEWTATELFSELIELGAQVRHLGKLASLPASLRRAIKRVIQTSKHNKKFILNIALNYGGQDEIVRAIRKLLKSGPKPSQVNEQQLAKLLDTGDLPPVDLVIRTSGTHRLSNFLIWQSAYAELYFADTVFWPDFSPAEFDKALIWYSQQKRNFGK